MNTEKARKCLEDIKNMDITARLLNEEFERTEDKKKKEKIAKTVKECTDKTKIIEVILFGLSDARSKEILYKKYILGYTMKEISKKLNYTYQYTRILHIKALEQLEEIINQQHNTTTNNNTK